MIMAQRAVAVVAAGRLVGDLGTNADWRRRLPIQCRRSARPRHPAVRMVTEVTHYTPLTKLFLERRFEESFKNTL
jgi:hypothetical protein